METLEELQKKDLKMTDILTDKITDKELQRLKILEEIIKYGDKLNENKIFKI